jgi:glycosyltransferase involved in cell wall biosynthesis
MYFYSIVIPVYNRPAELKELLQTLTEQTYKSFEVLVVEDGSPERCESIVDQFKDQLDIQYLYKENTGQGFSRNYGFEHARGDYFVVFDSDCLIPANYFQIVDHSLITAKLDAYGGPDKAHESFNLLQKAISYSMTSVFTTGGIRGAEKRVGAFQPRSFNMGISRAVYDKTKGYKITRMGEDIELSIRIKEHGFRVGLIPDAFVYHKRRTSLGQFYQQLHFFGRARVNISRFYPGELKLIHLFPAMFLLAMLSMPLWYIFWPLVFEAGLVLFGLYFMLIMIDSTIRNMNVFVGGLSVISSIVQLTAYGIGFIQEGIKKLISG